MVNVISIGIGGEWRAACSRRPSASAVFFSASAALALAINESNSACFFCDSARSC